MSSTSLSFFTSVSLGNPNSSSNIKSSIYNETINFVSASKTNTVSIASNIHTPSFEADSGGKLDVEQYKIGLLLKNALSTPQDRLEWVDGFFERHQGIKTSIFPWGEDKKINYGKDIVDFMEWEISSGRLGDENGKGGSFYWKIVNGSMIADMLNAEELVKSGKESLATENQKNWVDFIHDPNQKGLWKAHNESIVSASIKVFDSGALLNETPAEQAFIYSVLYRVIATQALNFPSSDGIIGSLIDSGPLKYPAQYPARWEDPAVYPNWDFGPITKKKWRELFE